MAKRRQKQPDPSTAAKKAGDAVREAVEQTFEATAGSAGETRERATALFDQVIGQGREAGRVLEQRGADARRFVERRGSEAREASAAIGSRVAEAIGEIQKRLRP